MDYNIIIRMIQTKGGEHMKKAVSIVIAIVMVLSLAVIGVSAADVKNADKIPCLKLAASDGMLPDDSPETVTTDVVMSAYYILHITLKRSIIFLNIAN